MKDAPLKKCPQCKGRVRRLLGTGAGLIFKGSGFYTTDYRSENYKSAAKKELPKKEPAKQESPSPSTPDKKSDKK